MSKDKFHERTDEAGRGVAEATTPAVEAASPPVEAAGARASAAADTAADATESATATGVDLEALFREADLYLADDGFTEQVMARLPPPRPAARARRPVLAVAMALAAALAIWIGWDLATALGLLGGGATGSGAATAGPASGLWHEATRGLTALLTWSPAPLPPALPLVPLLLALLVSAGALLHAHRRVL